MIKPHRRLFCFTLAAGALFATPAFAYLDPGTGSIILQGLLAAIAGGLVWMSAFWHKVKSFFRRGDSDRTDVPSPDASKR